MAAPIATLERASCEKMLLAARAAETPSIDACRKESGEPTSTNPPAEVLGNIPEEGAFQDDQDQNAWHERSSDQPNQSVATAKVAPAMLIIRWNPRHRQVCQQDHSS